MEDSPFYQYILDQGMEKGVEKGFQKGIEAGMLQGIEQGVERGRHEGEIQGFRSALLHQGQKKFGAPPKAVRLAIQGIDDHEILDALLLKLLDVANWLDLLENVPEGCISK